MFWPVLLAATTAWSAPNEASERPEIVPAEPAPGVPLPPQDAAGSAPTWKGSVTLGLTFTEGNSRIRSIAAGADAKRETKRDTWKLRSWWNLQQQNSVTSQSDAGATVDYNYNATERLYYLLTGGVDHDDQADLAIRWWAGGGAGYRFLTKERTKLSGDAAVTYFEEHYQHGLGTKGYVAARFSYDFFQQISDTTKFEQVAEIFPSLEDKEDVYAKVDSKLRMDITSTFYSQIQYVFDWDNTPTAGNRRDDHKIVVGLGWTFGG